MSPRAHSHLNLPPTPKKPLFSGIATLLLLIAMVIGFFISQLIGVYIAGRLVLPNVDTLSAADIILAGSADGTVVSLSILISGAILLALSGLLIKIRGGQVRRYLQIKTFKLMTALKLSGLLLLFMIASQLLTYVLDKDPMVFITPLYESVSSIWLFVLAIVIVAPLYEEVIFRGLLWSALAEQFNTVQLRAATTASVTLSTKSAIAASLVTSLIFATIHLQYGLYEISTLVVLALIFCYARIKSGSLLLPIMLHIVNNGVALALYMTQMG